MYPTTRQKLFVEMLEYDKPNTTSAVGILPISIFNATGIIYRVLRRG